MNVQSTRIDLGQFGSLATYDFSGDAGELVHEFAPLREHANEVAIFVAENAHLREALTLERGAGGEPVAVAGGRSGVYQDEVFSAVAVPIGTAGLLARFRYFGNAGVALHVAVVKNSRRAIRRVLQAARRKLLRPAFKKFQDPCWVCQRVARFLISLVLSAGVDVDAEDIEDFLRGVIPEEWLEHLDDTDLGQMIKRILDFLRRNDPRRVVARKVCETLGYCRPESKGGGAPAPEGARLKRALDHLKSKGIADPDIDLFLATLAGDTAGLSAAIARGANVNITDTELLKRHAAALRDLPP